MEGSDKRVTLLSRYFVSEKQKSKGCRGLTVEIPPNSSTVGQFFKDTCERFSLKCISKSGTILKVKGTSISHESLVTILRDDDHIKVEGVFLRTDGAKLSGEKNYTGGISSCSYFSDFERKMNHSVSTAASVCGPTRKLDDAVNSLNAPRWIIHFENQLVTILITCSILTTSLTLLGIPRPKRGRSWEKLIRYLIDSKTA